MKKILKKLASEICSNIELEKEAEKLLEPQLTPEQYLKLLMDDGQHYSAVLFLAHALPKRESVWWACVCTRATISPATTEDNLEALKLAEQWVYNPTEEFRRQAEKLAEKTEYRTPASWAAMAAFWSGGSITAIDEPPVPPAAHLYASAVSGSVNLAATFDKNRDPEALYKQFLNQGIDIANGGNGEVAAMAS